MILKKEIFIDKEVSMFDRHKNFVSQRLGYLSSSFAYLIMTKNVHGFKDKNIINQLITEKKHNIQTERFKELPFIETLELGIKYEPDIFYINLIHENISENDFLKYKHLFQKITLRRLDGFNSSTPDRVILSKKNYDIFINGKEDDEIKFIKTMEYKTITTPEIYEKVKSCNGNLTLLKYKFKHNYWQVIHQMNTFEVSSGNIIYYPPFEHFKDNYPNTILEDKYFVFNFSIEDENVKLDLIKMKIELIKLKNILNENK